MSGRRTPYTTVGIARVPCSRCGKPSKYQWQVCADSRVFRGICATCDIALNHLVLTFMRIPDAAKKMSAYRRKVQG